MYCKELFGFRNGFIFPVATLRLTSKKFTSDMFIMTSIFQFSSLKHLCSFFRILSRFGPLAF